MLVELENCVVKLESCVVERDSKTLLCRSSLCLNLSSFAFETESDHRALNQLIIALCELKLRLFTKLANSSQVPVKKFGGDYERNITLVMNALETTRLA